METGADARSGSRGPKVEEYLRTLGTSDLVNVDQEAEQTYLFKHVAYQGAREWFQKAMLLCREVRLKFLPPASEFAVA